MMVFSYRTSDIHRREKGKYVGLNGSYQQLNHVDKGHHDRRKHSNRVGFKDEYQGDKGKNYNVTRCDRDK